MIVHRLAWIALCSLIILVVVGATVRVTGSGLGCPDWPTCWGCLIPPTSADQIDVDKLDIEKFKRHAAKKGIDPDTITRETVLESFDPVHTWIEFGNRLTSLPLGFASLLLALFSFRVSRYRWWVVALAWLSLFDVLANAIMGAVVVRSGLQPGIITLHMALAFLLIAFLVTIIWLTRPESKTNHAIPGKLKTKLLVASVVFFACLFAEGLLGSQLREQTDELQKAVSGLTRDQWTGELASTIIFKIHRSFSWTLLIAAGLILFWAKRCKEAKFPEPVLIFAFVIFMMVMGIILGHVAISAVVQVLHVAATGILLAITWHWLLRLWFQPTGCDEPIAIVEN
jgi:cytochrome c oxidase assembly protein subunit 15